MKYDLLLLPTGLKFQNGYVTVVDGAQKLAQRALLQLLTTTGTVAMNTAVGGTLLMTTKSGIVRDSLSARLVGVAAAARAAEQLRDAELPADAAAERLKSLTLRSVSLQARRVTYTFYLTTQAGVSTDLTLPPLQI